MTSTGNNGISKNLFTCLPHSLVYAVIKDGCSLSLISSQEFVRELKLSGMHSVEFWQRELI